jgi:cellobiose epimerase
MELNKIVFTRHLEDILRFWERAIDDKDMGGFHTYLGYTGGIMDYIRYRPLTIQARQLYNHSEGLRQGFDFALRGAEHVYKYIRESMLTQNGWYTTVYEQEQTSPERMDTYDNMFVVIGMGRYAEATGRKDVMEEALRLFLQVEEMTLIDGDLPREGLIGSVKDEQAAETKTNLRHRRFSRHKRKGHYTGNSNLHYLEAMAVLDHAFKARPEFADLKIDFRQRVEALRDFFMRYIYDAQRNLTFDAFRDGFNEPFDIPGAVVSLAHGLEWVGFFRSFDGLHLDEEVERALLEKGRLDGLKDDGLFEDYFYLAENETARGGSFWPQVEAVLTFNAAAGIYGQPYDEAFHRAATYYFEHFIDPEGGVHMYIDRNGVVTKRSKGDRWKCDYHSVRMCIDVIEREKGAFNADA